MEKEELDKKLMEAGYLCSDFTIHSWKLLEWEGNIRNMKCEKCGNISPAMAKTFQSNPLRPTPNIKNP